jgi:O-antigen/teichoic acid export membrane protein
MVVSRIAGVLTLVVSVPFVVAALGAEGYGVWESLLAIAGFALVFQMAISGTVVWRISMMCGSQDDAEARRIVRLGLGSTAVLTALLLPPMWIWRTELLALLHVPDRHAAGSGWLLPAIVGVALLGGLNETLSALLTGYQRAGLAALIHSVGVVSTHGSAVALLMAGFGLKSLVYGYLVGLAARFAMLYPVASSLCGRLTLLPLVPSRRDLRILGPFAGLLLISGLSGLVRDQTDKIVLASLATPLATAHFGMAQRLASVVMQTFIVVRVPFGAAIGVLFAREDWDGIRSMYETVGSWIAVLAGLAGFLVWSLRSPLLTLWLGRDYPQVHVYLALQLFGVVSAVLFSGVATALAKGVGRPGLETTYATFTLLLTLLAKPLFIAWLGAVGSVASSAAAWAPGAFLLLVLTHRQLVLGKRLILRHLVAYVFTIGACLLSWLVTDSIEFPPNRLRALLVVGGVGPFLAAGYLLALGLLRLTPPLDWPGSRPDDAR